MTDSAWRASPLASDRHIFEVSRAIALEVAGAADRSPSSEILVEIACVTDCLLQQEDIESFTLDWALIENDAVVAVEARQMLARRKRWALDYPRMIGVLRRQLVGAFTGFVNGLPESCFEELERGEEPAVTVPLVSLLDDAADAIERLILALYDDDTMRSEIFVKARERIATNLLIASGFTPTTNIHEVTERLVLPTRQKQKSGAELAELYLVGTPFASLLDLPVPFHVPDTMRFEHCHIIGGTGHGKTQLMQRMIHADLVAARKDGRSVVVIDSQGDLINKLVRLDLFSPDARDSLADRLVLIDPADVEFPAALNLFDAHLDRLAEYRPVDRERVLNGVVELYESFFGALLGAELTQKQGVIFRYLARLMLIVPCATIHTLMELMEDGKPFREHMAALEGSARHFFEKEFFHPSFAATKKQILKRLWGVLSTPSFERMFAQKENKLDLFTALNDGKIVLINTAKDLLKTEGSQLFGRFFVSMLSQAALERSTIPEDRRTPTYVYVDEAQEYFDDTIETILSQARKYRLGITLAHQTLDQLTPRLRAAFLSNTSFKCAGGVSNRDARALAAEMRTTPDFIENMRRRSSRTEFAVWLKHRTPSALRLTVPLGFLESRPTLDEDEYESLIDRNRARYSGSRAVEALNDSRNVQLPEHPTPSIPEVGLPAETAPRPAQLRDAPHREPRPALPRELGKGGPKHRYLQSLVKELAQQQGFRATIEAPLPSGGGQVDILLERDGVAAAVEISVTTPANYECHNLRKCLASDFDTVALVLAKSRTTQARYTEAVLEGLSEEERARVRILIPEDLPAFIASLGPPIAEAEPVIAGYKVRTTKTVLSEEEAQERRSRLASLIARSLSRQRE
ncbi:MAG TPA: type IV secretion system DNA-binding domain-containing protein [Allosphingosinicella sp.]